MFETSGQAGPRKILISAMSMTIFLTSLAIFIHWMWFSKYDMVIGKRLRKNALKYGDRLYMKGLALPSSYYTELKQRKEERRKEELELERMR
ncbi:hypothetical protein CRE_05306 [Caenorhabditis remanei]|uniref:Uncharacterized protein n=1 Tax=Caenorhabditis remanei TaxID=31234 RepID=E3NPJ4_CAERE|nr:hypothetical protein CRE_05306 [Caenorhabditis remanei]